MKLSYRLKRVCGNVYENGNIVFTSDGNALVCPVGNRITLFDLVHHTSTTLPFQNRKNIKRVAVSHNGRFLVSVDVDGHALFVNLQRCVVLQRFNFKRKVYDVAFSPDDAYFAVTFGHGVQLWRTPGIRKEFCPLTLSRTLGGHHDDTVCVDWSADSSSVIMGSKDLSCRVYSDVHSKHMHLTVLSGHRDRLVGAFFSADGLSAYTVARDGAVFTWSAEVVLVEKKDKRRKRARKQQTRDDTEEEAEDEEVPDDDSDDGGDADDHPPTAAATAPTLVTKTTWKLTAREFLWEPHTSVTSAAFNKVTNLLVVGFNKGVFGLYEMPGCTSIHKLSVSHHSLNAAAINASGEWLALGSTRLGQLLVWEWQSETYVLKQQGHLYGIQALDFASDGQLIATGGEDAKVKLWNASSGFCFVTFSEHVAPVTGVRFVGKGAGKAVLSCSLDGTVRAHDLLRYRNFRTLTTPQPAQFTSLAVDLSGEVVCAGAMDPFHIYVWSLQTGRLLDVLTGHEGPVACLDFSPTSSVLASGSWDGTLKLWDVYKNSCTETMEHGCDVLAVAFRPDGREVVTAATNGNLHMWEVESGQQVGLIEGQRDITGGAVSTDKVSAANALRSKHFTTVAYTPDGQCVLAAGLSKYACVYAVASGALVKKFQLSYNRSLEGVVDNVRSDQYADGVPLAALGGGDSDDEHHPYSALPGAGGGGRRGGADGSRSTRPEVLTAAVRFSPTGREWAAATTQGLQVFSLDDAMQFAPTDLDVAITPQSIRAAAARHEYGLAVNMALHLAEPTVLKEAVDAVPADAVELVVKSLDPRMLRAVLRFLAEEVAASRHVEYYLAWCWAVLRAHGAALQADSLPHLESLRALIRAVGLHEKEVMRMSDENLFSLEFLATQGRANAAANANAAAAVARSSSGGRGGGDNDDDDDEPMDVDGEDEDDDEGGDGGDQGEDDEEEVVVEVFVDTRKSAVRESLSSSGKKGKP